MTDISPEDRDLIDRYLAKRLNDTEAHVIETRIVEDRAFRNEVELTAAFRDGLRELQDRGEVTPLLSPRRTVWRHPRLAMAASATAVAIGLTSFLLYQRIGSDPALAITESLVFVQTRGADPEPDVVWAQTGERGRIELRLDPGLEPAAAYQIVVERVMDGVVAPVFLDDASPTADGEVVVAVNAAAFEPGDYAIRLTPQSPASSDAVVFRLRVTGGR